MGTILKAPEGATSISVGQSIYQVIEGKIEAEEAHVEALLCHGFSVAVAEAKKALGRNKDVASRS